ncbi:beta,beta-carotene 9',10'-dioxygenase [Xylariales sp. PMI_506]|nr:beta,beta-carotene 9',10'-dioxygenase [Xylariales sp. PMI_506]
MTRDLNGPSGQENPVTRGPGEEEEDYERVVQRMLESQFQDWPNEAGFEGLTEIQGPVELKLSGSIPSWAAGSLYRTGPGLYNVEDTPAGTFRTTHWFDGIGHSHKFDIIPDESDSCATIRVEYTSRRQSQKLVEMIRKTGQRHSFSFGQRQDPCMGLFGKFMSVWRMPIPKRSLDSDNVSVAVQCNVPGLPSRNVHSPTSSGHRAGINNIWLTTDTNAMKEVDQDTMEPIGFATQEVLHPLLKGPLSCAHAQRDPNTGDFFNYNLEFGMTPTYRIFRTTAQGVTDILATIAHGDVKPAYIHSFFLSPSYVIFCIPSTHIGNNGLRILWQRNVLDAIEPFDETKLCKWFIVDRISGRGVVATYSSPAGFFFHSINSFEETDESTGDTHVFCDVVEYPTADVLHSFAMDVILQNRGMTQNYWGNETRNRNTHARFARHKFRIPPQRVHLGSQTDTPLYEKILEIKCPHIGELPTINPLYATKRYRYIYSLPNRGFSTLLDSLAKTDIQTGTTIYWDNPRGHTPGEAVFVPRPKDKSHLDHAEDDGIVLSVVLDGINKISYLVCLDARDMKEVGRAECSWPIAIGFHGLHAPAETRKTMSE